mgnify:CR=1 FL=1
MGIFLNGSTTNPTRVVFNGNDNVDRVIFRHNNVDTVVWQKDGNPFADGYTLYGDYFLSNTIIPNKTWNEACAMTESVTVTQNGETKIVTARTLSKSELKTLSAEQRKISENGHTWYWTSTPIDGSNAWSVIYSVDFRNSNINYSGDNGGARLGFKNPFI